MIWHAARPDGEGPWSVRRDGRQVEVVPGHYETYEVLAFVESLADQPLAWHLDGDSGFTTAAPSPAPDRQ